MDRQALAPLYHYVVIRKDLPLGIQAAQIVHAAGESSPGNLPSGTHAVVLAVRNERELLAVCGQLAKAGVAHHCIVENDAPFTGESMAIGIVPRYREEVAEHLRHLNLL